MCSRALIIGHYQVAASLCFKARLSTKPKLWEWVLFPWKWNSLSLEMFSTKHRIKSEGFWHWKMAYSLFPFSFKLLSRNLCTLGQWRILEFLNKSKGRDSNDSFVSSANYALCWRVQPWTGHQDRCLHRVHGESPQHLQCGWFHIYIVLVNDQ